MIQKNSKKILNDQLLIGHSTTDRDFALLRVSILEHMFKHLHVEGGGVFSRMFIEKLNNVQTNSLQHLFICSKDLF